MQDKRDHIKLICGINELVGLFTDSTSLETFLQRVVETVARHMKTDVCSIYLFYEHLGELVLKATVGLNHEFVGNVKLKLDEGLTGLALKELRPICERHASRNPNFVYFPGLGEEQYESFLAVPIIRGSVRVGVMVVQNTIKNYFCDRDINALQAITSQLANTIEMTRFILSFKEDRGAPKKSISEAKDLKLVKGKVGSAGVVFGKALIISDETSLNSFCQDLAKRYTLNEFYEAVHITEKYLRELQERIKEKFSDVASLIFTAQILMLKDKGFIDAVVALIKDGINPPIAIVKIIEEYIHTFNEIPSPYLREKTQDILDVGKRLLSNLIGESSGILNYEDKIVIAKEILPSDIVKMSLQKVRGVIILSGGVSSHLSILARSLQLPLIISEEPLLLSLLQGTEILMDAEQGNIHINPSTTIIESFKNRQQASSVVANFKDKVSPVTYTKDMTRIVLMANINLLGDLKIADEVKAEGIGLYRTEFPFIVRSDFPTEEEQFCVYKKVVDAMKDKLITFRTLDIGGDKLLSYFPNHNKEANPFLGMRSIRFSLRYKDIFIQQVRAILRAGYGARIRIMFPMISSLDEFLEAKSIVYETIDLLERENISCNNNPEIGFMVELPAVLEIIEELVVEADFLSIGTNDFIQYMLAVDRTNEMVADLYVSYHPSVLRALKRVVDTAYKYNKSVSICGDMAHEEIYLKYLLGIGIRELSLNPIFFHKIQSAIQKITIEEAVYVANSILDRSSLREIMQIIR